MVNMGNVWDRTTEFLSDNLGAILPVALMAIFVPQSISRAVAQAGVAVNPTIAKLVAVAVMLVVLWGQLNIVALTLDPETSRAGARSTATRRFGPAVLATITLFAVFLLLALPFMGVALAGGVDLGAIASGAGLSQSQAQTALPLLLIYAVLVLAFGVMIALLYPVIVAEGLSVRAIPRAFALSRGIRWKMIGVYLLFGFVLVIAFLAVTFAFGALFRFLAPDAGPFGIGAIIVAILSGLVFTTYYVIVSIFSAKLYRAVTTALAGK